MQLRGQDAYGSGHFGASRGGGRRRHRGVDFVGPVGCGIYPFVAGTVTKLGFPYEDDPRTEYDETNYRYVQITDANGYDHRYFYTEPLLKLGQVVTVDTVIGYLQDLELVYPGICNHCHYEVKQNGRIYINPMRFAISDVGGGRVV